MTGEDLRKTVADIRQASHDVDMVKSMLETAADEIERLQNECKRSERMDYQDQLTIGNAFNEAIHRVLADYGVAYYDQPGMLSALAQAILVAIDQANYQIVRK